MPLQRVHWWSYWIIISTLSSVAIAFIHCNSHHHIKQKFLLYMHHQDDNDVTIHSLSELQSTSYKSLLNKINSNIKVVLIGEGTHGTQEFSSIRSEITKILIEECGFNAILCEGDVQPFYELNQLVCSSGSNKDAAATDCMLGDASEQDDHDVEISSTLSKLFENRFPSWMWSHQPLVEFISWLRTYIQAIDLLIMMMFN